MDGIKVIADFHIHTTASGDGFSTVKEISDYAKQIGLAMIAITDHGPNLICSAHAYYFKSLVDNIHGDSDLMILPGIEANILNDSGDLDIPLEQIEQLSFVIIAFHEFAYGDLSDCQKNTRAIINCLNRYPVDMIAHLNEPYVDLDIEAVLPVMMKKNTIIEINNKALRKNQSNWKNFSSILETFQNNGLRFMISSDAHYCEHVGKFETAFEFVNQFSIEHSNIINLERAKLEAFFNGRNKGGIR
jgi:putative hydrolase